METGFIYLVHAEDINKKDPFNYYDYPEKWKKDMDVHTFELPERRKEVQLIMGMGLPLFYAIGIKKNPFEADYTFFTQERNPVDTFHGLRIIQRSFGRRHSTPYLDLARTIPRLGGVPYVSYEEEIRIEQWAGYVKEEFLKRKIRRISLEEIFDEHGRVIEENVEPYKRNGQFFIKTERKRWAGLIDEESEQWSEFLEMMKAGLRHGLAGVALIISEPIDIGLAGNPAAPHLRNEYRCWVANHQIASISRYLNYVDEDLTQMTLHDDQPIPPAITRFVEEFVDAHSEIFPDLYVVDVALEREKGPLVVECGNLCVAGTYVNNDFSSFLKIVVPELDVDKLMSVTARVEAENIAILEKLLATIN